MQRDGNRRATFGVSETWRNHGFLFILCRLACRLCTEAFDILNKSTYRQLLKCRKCITPTEGIPIARGTFEIEEQEGLHRQHLRFRSVHPCSYSVHFPTAKTFRPSCMFFPRLFDDRASSLNFFLPPRASASRQLPPILFQIFSLRFFISNFVDGLTVIFRLY